MLSSIFFFSLVFETPWQAQVPIVASVLAEKGTKDSYFSKAHWDSVGVILIAKTAPEVQDLLPSACGLLLVQRPKKKQA